MTEHEKIEREIILDILAESSKWRISEEDQDDDCIRLEVMDRARRLLLGTETVDENGYAQSHPDNLPAEDEALTNEDFKALEAAKLDEHLASVQKVDDARRRWESKKVRVFIDGKHVWKPRAQCVKEPRDNSKGGAAWKWKFVGPTTTTDEKKAQEEAMWAEHEQEGK